MAKGEAGSASDVEYSVAERRAHSTIRSSADGQQSVQHAPGMSACDLLPRSGEDVVLGASKNGVQKRIGRPSDWTQAKADKFVEVLADSCNVSLAARAVKRSVGDVYRQRNKDAAFRGAWDQALAIGYARLEMMMLERALHGIEKVVTLKNGESKIMREYNDRVALALLRHHRDSVAAFHDAPDEEDYEEACDRIMERLQRLREREAESAPKA